MSKNRILLLKIFAAIVVLFFVALFFIAKRAYNGIGDSVVISTKAIHELSKTVKAQKTTQFDSIISSKIECSDINCEGIYSGPEFVDNSDIAHQFSNQMASKVGDKLKELYDSMKYSKVDFSKIKMSTIGMGTGMVEYKLIIPFLNVSEKCMAYTSFDHVGGWNHKPALARRKDELKDVLIEGHKLNISELKTTPEGLQEYWIQWKNKKVQSDCK